MHTETTAAPNSFPVAIITGGSAGLGLAIAHAFLGAGYRVAIIGRSEERLAAAAEQLGQEISSAQHRLDSYAGDLAIPSTAAAILQRVVDRWGRIDVLVNNVGTSDRGSVDQLTAERLMELVHGNVIPMLRTSQAALPYLEQSRGSILNIGSLAGKVGARYLGAYPAAKHALAGLTQQMRLEWKPRGVHVGLLSPGPIRRDDAGARYEHQLASQSSLPPQARLPGGGTRVRGQDPAKVAARVVRMAQRRQIDVLAPGYLRPLVAIGHLWPWFGDWLLLRLTSVKPPSSAES